jgi:hypothetical protein
MGIKDVGKNIFEDAIKYHQKVPEIRTINVNNLKRMNSGEVADVSDEVAAKMDFSKPIQVSVFADGELRIVDGHHRVAAAKKLGIQSLPVELQAINAKGATLNKLAQEATYPQQAALDLAQQRAALPVEQGGLGLPVNNTPEMRAQAMGFVDELFHGTQRAPEGILEFGGQTGYAGQKGSKANWFTTDPEQASLYANIIRGAGNPTVYPVKIKSGTQISEDAFSNLASKLNLDQNPEISLYNKKLQKELQKQGFDEMTFNPGQTEEQYKVVFDPANIRSRFAAYDPFRKDVATATAIGVALPDLLAAEKQDKQKKNSK